MYMMVGGQDVSLMGRTTLDDLRVILRVALEAWPEAWVESSDGATLAPPPEWDNFKGALDVFIYKNRELTEENRDEIVAVTFEEDLISFEINESEASKKLVGEMLTKVGAKRATWVGFLNSLFRWRPFRPKPGRLGKKHQLVLPEASYPLERGKSYTRSWVGYSAPLGPGKVD